MLFDRFRRSIFPRNCLFCQQKLSINQWFCGDCQQSLPRIKNACPICANIVDHQDICGFCLSHTQYFDSTLVPFEYRQPITQLIYKFKYKNNFYAYRPMVEELIALLVKSRQPLPEVIIPIPLHRRRLIRRGYNQSSLIARSLSKALSIPCDNKSLIRNKYAKPQIELTAKQREQAVRGAFKVNTKCKFKHVALVDDVISTSNTANQASKALKKSGVQTVTLWALARNT